MNILFDFFKSVRFRILMILGVAFFLSHGLNKEVFIANSPEVSPQFIAKLRDLPGTMKSLPQDMIALIPGFGKKAPSKTEDIFANLPEEKIPEGLTFAPLSKSVRAAEDPSTGQGYIQIDQGTQYQVTGTVEVVVNGQTYSVPKIEIVK